MKLPRSVNKCGLMAAQPVQWLMSNEPDVREAIRKFITGQSDTDYVDVATPPSWPEIVRAQLNPRHRIMLPLVRLRLKVVQQLDSWYVMVTTSDKEMEILVQMQRAKVATMRREIDFMHKRVSKSG